MDILMLTCSVLLFYKFTVTIYGRKTLILDLQSVNKNSICIDLSAAFVLQHFSEQSPFLSFHNKHDSLPFMKQQSSYITQSRFRTVALICQPLPTFLCLPLGGEQSVEVCAAGVAWSVLLGENICQDVIALTTRFVFTDELGLEKSGPSSLQSLHPPNIRLKIQREFSSVQANKKINNSVKMLCYLADPRHSWHFDFGV